MGKIYKQLSIEERTMIQTQLKMGIKPAAIAVGLHRSASTLSRELRRNGWARPKARPEPGRPAVAGGYRAAVAHQRRAQACHGHTACGAPPATRNRLVEARPALPEGGLLARADCRHTGRRAPRSSLRCRFPTKPSTPRSTPCHVARCARR